MTGGKRRGGGKGWPSPIEDSGYGSGREVGREKGREGSFSCVAQALLFSTLSTMIV